MKVRERRYASGRVGWQVDVSGVGPDGQPFRARLMAPEGVTSRSGATRWGEEQRRRIERGEVPATPRAARKASRRREEEARSQAEAEALADTTVAQAAAWWAEDGVVDRASPATVALRRRLCADHVVPELGARRVRDLCELDARRLKVRLASHSAGFARIVLRALRGVIDAAQRRGVPCDLEVDLPRDSVTDEPRAYDPAAFEAIVDAARGLGPQHLAVVLLTGEAGLRRGEVLGLRVGDVLRARATGALRVERVRIRVDGPDLVVKPPKSGQARTVPLSPRCLDAAAALAAARLAEGPDAWLLVKVRRPDAPAGEGTVRDLLAAAQRAAGFPAVGPHAARHTALSHLVASGQDLRTVQAIAGHKRIATTARYLHAMPEQVARAGAALEAWRAGVAGAAASMAPQPRKRAHSRRG